MNTIALRRVAVLSIFCLATGLPARAAPDAPAPVEPRRPGKQDVCPVCGMFVAPHGDWIAAGRFLTGEVSAEASRPLPDLSKGMLRAPPAATQLDPRSGELSVGWMWFLAHGRQH